MFQLYEQKQERLMLAAQEQGHEGVPCHLDALAARQPQHQREDNACVLQQPYGAYVFRMPSCCQYTLKPGRRAASQPSNTYSSRQEGQRINPFFVPFMIWETHCTCLSDRVHLSPTITYKRRGTEQSSAPCWRQRTLASTCGPCPPRALSARQRPRP